MSRNLVMTIIGADKPGLVESVSEVIETHGGNWLESRMARLAGQFAGIVHVEVADDRATALVTALETLAAHGVHVHVEQSGRVGEVAATGPARVDLELIGHDRPGIVHHITEVIARHGVNIDELATDMTAAPMSGGTMFTAQAQLTVPPDVDLDALRRALEKIAGDLMVDITLAADQVESAPRHGGAM